MAYFGRNREHGDAQICHMEEKCGDMVEAVDFSDKGHFGWLAHRESIFLNGETATVDTFNKALLDQD